MPWTLKIWLSNYASTFDLCPDSWYPSQSLGMRVSCPCHWRTSDMTLGQESDDLFRPLFIICYGHYDYYYWFVCGGVWVHPRFDLLSVYVICLWLLYLVVDCVCDTRLSLCLRADHSTQVCFIILVMLWYCQSSGLVIDSCVPVFLKSYSLLFFPFIHDPFLIPFILTSYRYDFVFLICFCICYLLFVSVIYIYVHWALVAQPRFLFHAAGISRKQGMSEECTLDLEDWIAMLG